MNAAVRLSWRLLAALALLLVCALQLLALLRAPGAWMPQQIAVTLARGASVTLGRQRAGGAAGRGRPPCAAARCAGPLVGRQRRRRAPVLLLATDAERRSSGSTPLAAGQGFQLGP
jgi:cell division protein FtsW